MGNMAFGPEVITKLQDAGIIPADMAITKVTIEITVDDPVMIYYETHADSVVIDHLVDELVKHKDRLTVKRVMQKITKSLKIT